MVMSPSGLGSKNDCAGEGQQQFARPDQLIALTFILKKMQADSWGPNTILEM
jgi:hypothetical protein